MTRRCSTCAINYPANGRKFEKCLVCDDATSFFSDLNPHEDWEARVASATTETSLKSSAMSNVAQNRLGRFRRAGLDLLTAMEYAGDRHVDLHLFERLREQGCPVETAARIVAPLP